MPHDTQPEAAPGMLPDQMMTILRDGAAAAVRRYEAMTPQERRAESRRELAALKARPSDPLELSRRIVFAKIEIRTALCLLEDAARSDARYLAYKVLVGALDELEGLTYGGHPTPALRTGT